MRRDRLVHLICALLGALASIITVISFCRTSPPPPEQPPPVPLLSATPAPDPTPLPAYSKPEEEATETVYRTPAGERYHRPTCRHVKGKEIALSLPEAKEQGLTPCRVCNPPPLP